MRKDVSANTHQELLQSQNFDSQKNSPHMCLKLLGLWSFTGRQKSKSYHFLLNINGEKK